MKRETKSTDLKEHSLEMFHLKHVKSHFLLLLFSCCLSVQGTNPAVIGTYQT